MAKHYKCPHCDGSFLVEPNQLVFCQKCRVVFTTLSGTEVLPSEETQKKLEALKSELAQKIKEACERYIATNPNQNWWITDPNQVVS